MSTTFSNALSGLTANARAIDVVSGNLANMNTTGFKANQVSFQELINESLGGGFNAGKVGGSTVAQSTRTFTQGSIQSTGQAFDAAIQGGGFFVLQPPSATGASYVFTRAGNFKLDSTGNLVTDAGDKVQGWDVKTNSVASLPAVSEVRNASPTANVSVKANLNAGAAIGDKFSSPVLVVDSLGASHTLTVTYSKTAANAWSYDVTIPAADLAAGGAAPVSVLPGGAGSVTFDGAGKMLTPIAGTPVALKVTGLADVASPMTINWSLYDPAGAPTLTQYNQASANLSITQDGNTAGNLTGVNIGTGGQIQAHYSNGETVVTGQLALASILNPDSLRDLGDNRFGLSASSSAAVYGEANTGSFGDISGGALETSTVDIAKEFTNLLTFERGYQANSKVITTEDEVMQDTIGLKR